MVTKVQRHVPVLLQEVIELLSLKKGGKYIDCTVGAGGHAEAMLKAAGDGIRVLGIDADPEAIAIAGERLARWREQVTLVQGNFRSLKAIAGEKVFIPADGILFDLGVSSMQLEESGRGFSFQYETPLDMRLDPSQATSAWDLVNRSSEPDLADIIYRYGEERRSRPIARAIVRARPLSTSKELSQAIESAVGRGKGGIHPATRTFQALRIAVNDELRALETALAQAIEVLRPGGRIVVISFHSGEDRTVKEFFRLESRGCICPPRTPACVCGHVRRMRTVTGKAARPSNKEIMANPRSRSARLRAAEVVAA